METEIFELKPARVVKEAKFFVTFVIFCSMPFVIGRNPHGF